MVDNKDVIVYDTDHYPKNKKTKVSTKNILVILSISVFLAVLFNYFNPKGITWFPQPETFADDSLLTKSTESSSDEISSSDDEFKSVSYQQVKAKLNDPEVVLIDARPVEEYEENRIGNAMSCFPYLDEAEFMQIILEQIPRDKIYIIYCHGGNCDLSHMVAERMKAFEFTDIFIYTAGWEEWSKKEGIN